MPSPPTPSSCCDKCPGQFCSPHSGNCYGWKKKDYYQLCPGMPTPPTPSSCCDNCPGQFCSPHSGNCYGWKKKDYYQQCPRWGASEPALLAAAEEDEPVGEAANLSALFYP
eukprot:TRINITY_DN12414_c0_g2_i2.p2 TRINITY_DN12414_c0_g2~~TRINITY_DN12414_c0_g2_i2.p2  ORF type:complete len:122 (-),score=30.85 TRINITY_DN12414_c0_g2_i2:436-768(-)